MDKRPLVRGALFSCSNTDPDYSAGSAFRQLCRLTPYKTRQKTLAGMNPNCEVRKPMTQMMMLLIAASIQPSQHRLPTRIVERIVKTQEI